MTKLIKSAALAAATAGLFASAVPAGAVTAYNPAGSENVHAGSQTAWQHSRDRGYRDRGYRDGYRYRDYRGSRVHYGEPVYNNTRVWRGRDGRYYCRKRDGTTGLIIGGAVGALLGREIDGGYNRSLGTILGAAGGALLGRSIDRSNTRCR
ncbi:MAG: glycine zipper 2TM domain-containing protein [Novosphingobium sp.]|nr:glycine zipper 2TM domain-containing protein [Novosphingobium sp.]MCP5404482.1 glycine zipper 2TM domain-containing protein [Novosphingobium sp.]